MHRLAIFARRHGPPTWPVGWPFGLTKYGVSALAGHLGLQNTTKSALPAIWAYKIRQNTAYQLQLAIWACEIHRNAAWPAPADHRAYKFTTNPPAQILRSGAGRLEPPKGSKIKDPRHLSPGEGFLPLPYTQVESPPLYQYQLRDW